MADSVKLTGSCTLNPTNGKVDLEADPVARTLKVTSVGTVYNAYVDTWNVDSGARTTAANTKDAYMSQWFNRCATSIFRDPSKGGVQLAQMVRDLGNTLR